MVYIFLGERFFRKRLIDKWKENFIKKYSGYNIVQIVNIFEYDISFLRENLLGRSFFSEKRLFIINDFPFGLNDEISLKYNNFFIEFLENISEDIFLVFNSEIVDRRSKLFKMIKKHGEIKDFSINNENDLKERLKEIYKDKIDVRVINKLISLKGFDYSLISSEIDKLLITSDYIHLEDLEFLSSDIDENIFEIINNILNLNTKQAILQIRKLKNELDNNYLLYNYILSNLRIYFYIFKLKDFGMSNNEIINFLDLGKRGFLLNKQFKIKKSVFYKMYEGLLEIEAKIKTGKLIGNQESDLMYEIEKSLIIYF